MMMAGVDEKPLMTTSPVFGASTISKQAFVFPTISNDFENPDFFLTSRPMAEELQEVIYYLSEFKASKIVTPFKGTSIALSKDKTRFFFGSREGRIGVAKIDTKETILEIDLKEGTIWTIALCDNDRTLFSGGCGGIIRRLSTSDMSEISRLIGHEDEVNVIFISNDEKKLFSASDDGQVIMWDITEMSPKPNVIIKHNSRIVGLDLSVDNKYIVSGSADATASVYDLIEQKEIIRISNESYREYWSVKITPKNTWLVLADGAGMLYLYKFGTWELSKSIKIHTRVVRAITATSDDKYIITGGYDNDIKLWELGSDNDPITFEGHTDFVKFLLLSDDSKIIYSMSDDCSIQMWKIPPCKNSSILSSQKIDPTKIYVGCQNRQSMYTFSNNKLGKFSFNNKFSLEYKDLTLTESVIGILNPIKDEFVFIEVKNIYHYNYFYKSSSLKTNDFSVTFINPLTCETIRSEIIALYQVCSAIISHDGKFLIIGEDHRCTIFFYDTLIKYHSFLSHKGEINRLALSLNGVYLFASDEQNIVKCLNIVNRTEVKGIKDIDAGSIKKMVVSRDNEFLIVLHTSGIANVWSIARMIKINTLNLEGVLDIIYVKNADYMFCLYETLIKAIHFPTFITSFEIVLRCKSVEFEFSNDFKEIYVLDEKGLMVWVNPLTADRFYTYGGLSPVNKFYQYLGKLAVSKEDIYDPAYNNCILEPFHINMMHLYAYLNKNSSLAQCIQDNCPFIISKSNYTALDICLQSNNEIGINILYSRIKQETIKNPMFLSVLQNSITRICKSLSEKAYKFLDLALSPSIDSTLGRYRHSNVPLPLFLYSSTLFCDKTIFSDLSIVSTEGETLQFFQTYFKLNMNPGANESLDLIKVLISTENETIFLSKFVKIVLEEKWKKIRSVLYIQALLYLLYLIVISCYSTFEGVFLLIFSFVLNVILILYELKQAISSGSDYFSDPWNYLDLIRLIFATLMFITDIIVGTVYSEFIIAIVLLVSWMRGIAYFRVIKATRYYINLIYEVILDIIPFLMIVLYSTLAFSFIFERVFRDPTKEPFSYFFYLSMSWELNLGSFSSDEYSTLMYFAFVLHAILNPILMLNLLISVMSNTFERVNSQVEVADSKELAKMILEAELVYAWNRDNIEKEYLYMIKGVEIEEIQDSTLAQVRNIKRKVADIGRNQSVMVENINKLTMNVNELKMCNSKNLEEQQRLLENQRNMESIVQEIFTNVKSRQVE
ncbi:hypothetical protein SteCoe_33313 [Stentor coeruleus]|uniref:Ion transport domain-containing protein n=1 Tax=Stentor coeruleus TaxID=5963 RepID=A0A1R2AXF2_9CILI|nr:hypothetical protein SteCoe_33313 [Stentor coeruleus]